MNIRVILVVVVAACTAGVLFTRRGKEPSGPSPHFSGLGDLPGGEFQSAAASVSADGRVAVGYSLSATGREAFRWTPSDGMRGLGFTEAASVSADGSVVVGYQFSRGQAEPARWTHDTGVEFLSVDEDDQGGAANGVSANGAIIVGSVDTDRAPIGERDRAYRWTRQAQPGSLISRAEPNRSSEANAVSADGACIVGWSRNRTGHKEACAWTTDTEPVMLGALPGHTTSIAYGVSADGSTVVGCSSDYMTTEAFRWTRAAGMISLGILSAGSGNSAAYGVSADGSVVVGYCTTVNGWEAIVWSNEKGMRSVRQVLSSEYQMGGKLRGWKLLCATAVSSDGDSIVGFGLNPAGRQEAWIARLETVGANQTELPATAAQQAVGHQLVR